MGYGEDQDDDDIPPAGQTTVSKADGASGDQVFAGSGRALEHKEARKGDRDSEQRDDDD